MKLGSYASKNKTKNNNKHTNKTKQNNNNNNKTKKQKQKTDWVSLVNITLSRGSRQDSITHDTVDFRAENVPR